ncbi:MAG: hypothetical protein WBW47_03640 [Thermoplasmata archaeon]
MDEGETEDPVVEADLADQERKRSAAAARPPRFWSWKILSAILMVCLIVVVGLFTLPVSPVTKTGTDWHSLASSNESYLLSSGALMPAQTHCVGSTTYLCTHLWIAFNWSTLNGRVMAFEFSVENGASFPYPFIPLYNATNLSFGGYSMACGGGPLNYCPGEFLITTNDTSSATWYFQWAVLYDYPTNQPVL